MPSRLARWFVVLHLGLGPATAILWGGALAGAAALWPHEPGFEAAYWCALGLGMAAGAVPSSFAALSVGLRHGFPGLAPYLAVMTLAAWISWRLLRAVGTAPLREGILAHPKLSPWAPLLDDSPFFLVAGVRLAPFAVFTWTNALAAATPLRSLGYLAATALGAAPRAAALVLAGMGARDFREAVERGGSAQVRLVVLGAAVAGLLVLSALVGRVLLRRRRGGVA